MAIEYKIIKVDIVDRNLLRIIFGSIPMNVANVLAAARNFNQESNKIIEEMDNWCLQCECGWKESGQTFGFESNEAMNMFLLRWS